MSRRDVGCGRFAAARRMILFPFLIPGLLVGSFEPSSAAPAGTAVLSSSSDRLVVEVAAPEPQLGLTNARGERAIWVEDWSVFSDPGVPELPHTGFQVAIPPGTVPVLEVQVVESRAIPGAIPRPVPRYTIIENEDELPHQIPTYEREAAAWGDLYPTAWAMMGEVGTLRHLEVVTIQVNPYRWDPGLGGLQVARKLRVEIRFQASPQKGMSVPREIPAGEHPSWERVYRRAVLNADQAVAWRRSPSGWRNAALRRPVQVGGEFRIDIEQTDLYRLTYDALVAAGWTESDVPLDRLALVERLFDETDPEDPFHEVPVAIHVRDRNGNQVFDGSPGSPDEIWFLGQTAWDRLHPPHHERRYGRRNAYFLSIRPEGGARMATGESFLGQTLAPVESTPWTTRLEGDGIYMQASLPADQPSSLALGTEAIRSEHFYWTGDFAGDYDIDFDLPAVRTLTRLRIALTGVRRAVSGNPAAVSFRLFPPGGDVTELPPVNVVHRLSVLYELDEADLAGVELASTGNRLRMSMPSSAYGAAIDWIEWVYERGYEAVGGRVAWSTGGLTGPQEFRLTGFTPGDDLLLFDLSDSTTVDGAGPRVLTISPSQFDQGALRIQVEAGDGARPQVFLATLSSAAANPVAVARTSDDDLTIPAGDEEEVIVLTPAIFADGIEPLVQARENEGFRVRKVLLEDLFDQFNGGRPWPTAIRNYLRYLFRARTQDPSFLLLVGDASEDFTGILPQSDPNFLPTQSLFSNAFLDYPELVGSDVWFVDDLQGTGEQLDFRPDMHIGRLSVGSTQELSTVVDKILDYGEFREQDVWRARGLLVSDDEYSNRINFAGQYNWYGDIDRERMYANESIFRGAARAARRIVRQEAGFSEFVADSFFTATYMDTMPCLGRCTDPETNGSGDCHDWRCVVVNGDLAYGFNSPVTYATPETDPDYDNYDFGLTYLRPILRGMMNRGHLFVSYQGHANARLLSHEYIFQDAPFNLRDVSLLANNNRPFFFQGYGCHIAEFSAWDEGRLEDGLGEKLLFADNGRGAIASFASSAYEWLNVNDLMNLALFRAWWVDPPQDIDGRTRWLLGEIVTGGKAILVAEGNSSSRLGMVPTYNLLGDPTMTMEMAAPRMRVEVNGSPWAEGAVLTAEAASDTARIRVWIQDETHLEDVAVLEAGVPVDPTRYRLEPNPDYPGDDRRRILAYDPTLAVPEEDYLIEVEARDLNGLTRRTSFPVRLVNRFLAYRGGEMLPIARNDILEGGDTVRVELESPVNLETNDLSLRLDDVPLATLEIGGFDTRSWWIEAILPPTLSETEHRLGLRVARPEAPEVVRETVFLGPASGETRLLQLYNFPNPFDRETTFHYRLNRSAERLTITVYTLSGRRIWRWEESPAPANGVPIDWDGRDLDGDEVANGLYFYRVEIRTAEGRKLSRVERLARVR